MGAGRGEIAVSRISVSGALSLLDITNRTFVVG